MDKNYQNSNKFALIGGVSAVASFFGIRSQSVSGWLARGEVPAPRMLVLSLIFPRLFGDKCNSVLDSNTIKLLDLSEEKISKLTRKIDIEVLRESEDFAVIRKFFPKVLERSPAPADDHPAPIQRYCTACDCVGSRAVFDKSKPVA